LVLNTTRCCTIEGSLAGVQKAALPVVAAVGGFVLPTIFYAALNWGDPRLGGPGRYRYRICRRNLRIARARRSGIAEDVPAGAAIIDGPGVLTASFDKTARSSGRPSGKFSCRICRYL
jgi:hypothetical protein